ncbi:MAG: nucleotide exchange factor GrpE [Nitrospirota bacterium]|nr:nucleotide exchange factor GrpE [Nitrospirota bacterium]
MSEEELDKENEDIGEDDIELVTDSPEDEEEQEKPAAGSGADELNSKYLRLYADFENYRKRVNKDKEDLIRYGNESLLYELLPAIDNLELALKHAAGEVNSGLVQGVEVTLKELQRTLEKFGLSRIDAAGKPFDPTVHHAMSQVERVDMDEKLIAEEFRAGYRYRDKVLRPSLVAVSVKPQKQQNNDAEAVETIKNDFIEEEQ